MLPEDSTHLARHGHALDVLPAGLALGHGLHQARKPGCPDRLNELLRCGFVLRRGDAAQHARSPLKLLRANMSLFQFIPLVEKVSCEHARQETEAIASDETGVQLQPSLELCIGWIEHFQRALPGRLHRLVLGFLDFHECLPFLSGAGVQCLMPGVRGTSQAHEWP